MYFSVLGELRDFLYLGPLEGYNNINRFECMSVEVHLRYLWNSRKGLNYCVLVLFKHSEVEVLVVNHYQ